MTLKGWATWYVTVGCSHHWSDPDHPFVSRIEWGAPDADGMQFGTLTDTREGQRCLRCGVMRGDVCDWTARNTPIRPTVLDNAR